jgi:hypothetical protein
MATFEEILPRLVATYECGRLVPFIGSGMSWPVCVDWKTLVRNLERAAAADGEPEPPGEEFREPEPPREESSAVLVRRANAAVRKLQASKPGAFLAAVEHATVGDSGEGQEIPPQTKALAELWWPLVLTTNYDNVFEEAFARRFKSVEGSLAPDYSVVGRSPEDCQRVLNSLSTAGRSLIWALQGYFDRPFNRKHHESLHGQIVIGHEQYRRVTYREIHFRRAFAEVFRQRSLLFLGSGISETYLQDLFGEVLELFGPSTRPHYALLPEGAVDPDFMLSRFQITVTTYTVATDRKDPHQQVVENLRNLKQAVERNGERQAAWSWSSAASLAGATGGGPGLKIVRAPLPLSPPGPGHCLVVSAGGSRRSFFFSPGIQRVLPGWGVQPNQQPEVAEKPEEAKYIGVFSPKAQVYAVRARTEASERALSSIYTATLLVLCKAAAEPEHRCINMHLIAGGSVESHGRRPFPPRFSLVEMVRAYAAWRRENPDAVCDVAIHIIDEAVSREIASGRIDISELLNCRDIRFWAEIVLDSGELDRRLFQCMPEEQLGKIVGDMNLSPDLWKVDVTPPPFFEEPPQKIEPLLSSSLRELGVVPGSTLHFRRP